MSSFDYEYDSRVDDVEPDWAETSEYDRIIRADFTASIDFADGHGVITSNLSGFHVEIDMPGNLVTKIETAVIEAVKKHYERINDE